MQEEPSMDDILSSIRKILSGGHKKEKKEFEPFEVRKEPVSFQADSIEANVEEPFVLTPAMRVDQEQTSRTDEYAPSMVEQAPIEQADSFLPIQEEAVSLTEEKLKMNFDVTAELKPLIQKWLDENLPTVVEKVVREEVVRVLARVLK